MTTYLGALSHGAHSITIRRDGLLIRWTLCTPACVITQHEGPPHQAHDAIEQWITSVTDDWTEQAELRRRALDIRARIVTTPPQLPKLTIVPPPVIYGRIIAVCVDCGEETWWLRGRSTDGGNSVRMEDEAGRSYRVGHLLSLLETRLPITDEPRCPDCTTYRALPWWRRWLTRKPQP